MSFPITTVADYLDDWRRRRKRYRLDGTGPQPPPSPLSVQSQRGKRRDSASPYRGVHFYKLTGRWRVSYTYQFRTHTFGAYTTDIEAARAYDAKVRELIGPTALVNFPEGE